jgi:PhnB protein
MAKAIPEGYHTVTPYLSVKNAGQAIELYKKAFGAVEKERMPGPDGRIMHAEIQVGDSMVMLSEEDPQRSCLSPASLKATTGSLFLYVPDVDAAFKRATEAGCTVVMPVADMFWGDRFGQVEDPSGHRWGLATHKEDLTPEEIGKRAQAFFASMGQAAAGQPAGSQQSQPVGSQKK